jgi:hypothetical protein
MLWYEVTFSPEDIDAGRAIAMIAAFTDVCVAFAGPRDAGLFKSRDSAYTFYFSPGAARIAMPVITAFSGVACSAPARSNVQIAAADARLDEIPFADR